MGMMPFLYQTEILMSKMYKAREFFPAKFTAGQIC